MSALMELRGLSLMTTKICSSFSRLIKFPNQDFLASLGSGRQAVRTEAWYYPHPCLPRTWGWNSGILNSCVMDTAVSAVLTLAHMP